MQKTLVYEPDGKIGIKTQGKAIVSVNSSDGALIAKKNITDCGILPVSHPGVYIVTVATCRNPVSIHKIMIK